MRPVAHGPCSLRPAGARSSRRLDDKPPGFSMQFDLVGELRLIEEYLWDANAARVADLDDRSEERRVGKECRL